MVLRIIKISLLLFSTIAFSQVQETFQSTRLINSQTVEMVDPGELEFRISHRFGPASGGKGQLWGLDQATIRLGLEYGFSKNISFGLGRSTYQKTLDFNFKWKALHQSESIPISLVYLNNSTLNTLPWEDETRENLFSSRLAFVHQLLIARKFNDRLSVQAVPSIVHRNLVPTREDNNTLITMGIGGKYNFTKVTSIQFEYHQRIPDEGSDLFDNYNNSLSVGLGFDTRGHFFEFHFTNSGPMMERGYLTETSEAWGDGDYRFGFNIFRDFVIKKPRK